MILYGTQSSRKSLSHQEVTNRAIEALEPLPDRPPRTKWVSIGDTEYRSDGHSLLVRVPIGRASEVGVDPKLMWSFVQDDRIGERFPRADDLYHDGDNFYLRESYAVSSVDELGAMADEWRQGWFLGVAEIGLGRAHPVPDWFVYQYYEQKMANRNGAPPMAKFEAHQEYEPCTGMDLSPTWQTSSLDVR